jgi:hypothetical protein
MGGSGPPGGSRPKTSSLGQSCEDILIIAQLQSPSAGALSGVRVGMILPVILFEKKVLVVNDDSDIIGTIGGVNMARLAACMAKKHQYIAEVLQITGGKCKVKITHL